MSAEDSRGAAAGADCCRTAPQASTHKARRLRVNIVMNPVHGGIFARRNTHSIKLDFPYPVEISQAIVQSPKRLTEVVSYCDYCGTFGGPFIQMTRYPCSNFQQVWDRPAEAIAFSE